MLIKSNLKSTDKTGFVQSDMHTKTLRTSNHRGNAR